MFDGGNLLEKKAKGGGGEAVLKVFSLKRLERGTYIASSLSYAFDYAFLCVRLAVWDRFGRREKAV
jgi:hypothetical protein